MERSRSVGLRSRDRLTRRRALGLFGLGTVSLLVAACTSSAPAAAPTTAPAAAKPTTAPAAAAPAATTAPAPTTAPTAAPTTAPAAAPTATPAPAANAQTSAAPSSIVYGVHDPPASRQKTLDDFEKANPNIKVSIQQIQDFPVKIPTMAAAGTLPDVVRMWEAMSLDMARAGEIVALDDFIKTQTDFNPSDFIEVFWNYPVVNGKRYGLADAFAPHVNFYNKDLFDKASVAYPPTTQEWTWDAYATAAQKLSDVKNKIWGSDTIPVGWQYWTLKLCWQNGGDWYTPDYQKCLIDQPACIEATQYWADLLLKKQSMPQPDQAQATANGQGVPLFESGNVALERWGIWIAAALVKGKFKWNFVPEPMKTQRATILHTAFNTITKDSKNQQAAWTWLNAAVSTQGTYNYAHSAAFPSVRKSANLQKPWILDASLDVNWDLIPDTGTYGHVLPGPHNEQQALKLIGDALQAVYLGKQKAADAFKEVAPKVTDVVHLS